VKDIHVFGLENNQKQFYDEGALCDWDDGLLSIVPKKGPKLLLRALPFNDRLSRNESISVPENHTPAIRTKAEERSSTKIQESKFNPFTLKSFRVSSPNRKHQNLGGQLSLAEVGQY